jgi:hypothetical protein
VGNHLILPAFQGDDRQAPVQHRHPISENDPVQPRLSEEFCTNWESIGAVGELISALVSDLAITNANVSRILSQPGGK